MSCGQPVVDGTRTCREDKKSKKKVWARVGSVLARAGVRARSTARTDDSVSDPPYLTGGDVLAQLLCGLLHLQLPQTCPAMLCARSLSKSVS